MPTAFTCAWGFASCACVAIDKQTTTRNASDPEVTEVLAEITIYNNNLIKFIDYLEQHNDAFDKVISDLKELLPFGSNIESEKYDTWKEKYSSDCEKLDDTNQQIINKYFNK